MAGNPPLRGFFWWLSAIEDSYAIQGKIRCKRWSYTFINLFKRYHTGSVALLRSHSGVIWCRLVPQTLYRRFSHVQYFTMCLKSND